MLIDRIKHCKTVEKFCKFFPEGFFTNILLMIILIIICQIFIFYFLEFLKHIVSLRLVNPEINKLFI